MPLLPHFMLPLNHPNPTWNMSIARDFVLVTSKYVVYQSSLNTTPSNLSGVMDNSTNIYILRDCSLFIADISLCPLGADVGTVVRSSKPQGIGLAQIKWLDNDNEEHTMPLYNALYFPDSPVNIISVSKLGIDAKDILINIQSFTTYTILT